MNHSIFFRIPLILLVLTIVITGFATTCKKTEPSPMPSSSPLESAAPFPRTAKPGTNPALPVPITPPPLPGRQQVELLLVVRSFYLELNTPVDNSMVRNSTARVEGGTLQGSLVTVNGQIVALDGRGRFSVSVQLEEGPNSIDVIASDFLGNKRSHVITVIRLPS